MLFECKNAINDFRSSPANMCGVDVVLVVVGGGCGVGFVAVADQSRLEVLPQSSSSAL